MKRRSFMRNAISFSALIAFHHKAQALSPLALKKKTPACRFTELTLHTSKLEEQYDFYANTLKLPIISKDKKQFTLKIGESILRFETAQKDSAPFYHYAINIPSNKHEQAKKWLAERTPLLLDSDSGGDLFYFGFWDAHAMYFKDPAGNIGELIARHTLENDREGEFGISDLLCISEIGTPVADPSDFAAELKAVYDLDTFGSSMFIGDENGLFVAATIDRLWIPENTQKASVYPTDIYISDKGKEKLQYQDYPYHIKSKNQ